MNGMKSSCRTFPALRAALLGLAISTALPSAAHATGVAAGTLIENTASATYTSGSSTGSVTSNTVTVRVDELLDVAVAGLATTPVATGSTAVALPYQITNTGNGPEAFNLVTNPTVAGNEFDAVVQSIAVDTNGNGVYDPGTDQILPAGTPTAAIAPDASLTVFVLVTLPAGATDGDTSQIRLTAEAVTGTGPAGTTFAGQGVGGGDAVVGTSGGRDDGLDAIIASLATVSLAKSAAIADPFGGAESVPGAIITYSLVASVTGTGSASGLRITDVIPAGTTYQAGTLRFEGAPLSDAADADAGTGSASGIDVLVGTVPGGASRTVQFNVRIN